MEIVRLLFLEEVQNDKRAEELSRMMSGAEITSTTLQHSKELLTLAKDRKKLLEMSKDLI